MLFTTSMGATMGNKFDGFKKSVEDYSVEEKLATHCEEYGIGPLDAVKLFPVLARRVWLKRFLAHSDLFRQTLDVPGDIAELGVFRGLGLMTWANLLEIYCIGNRTKIVYGFDNWTGFTDISKHDGNMIPESGKIVGGFDPGCYKKELVNAIKVFDADRFIPQKARIKLVDGDIVVSVPRFVAENPGVRFSLVHFDCDLYCPTISALQAIWPVVSRGGILLFDEYGIADWPGETKAVDEFFSDKPGVVVKTLPWNNVPAGYVVKP